MGNGTADAQIGLAKTHTLTKKPTPKTYPHEKNPVSKPQIGSGGVGRKKCLPCLPSPCPLLSTPYLSIRCATPSIKISVKIEVTSLVLVNC
ncbi:MAG TPA: hypothetical protein DD000_24080 [Cyanobacteria bacterium UBA11166]|nr:hypothetical protein [Cyanobacteria bacterium UBA11166]